jgi:radical SAM superfamily enzyme YgiQ (UPF0313 family)
MDKRLQRILPRVQKPARYTGGEYGQVLKDRSDVELRMALCFPDTYEIGMSNLGMRLLYGILNQPSWLWCERVFGPWFDMEARDAGARPALYTRSRAATPSRVSTRWAFPWAMRWPTSVLNLLDLAGIPLRSADRQGLTPLVFAGGACCVNPEPLAPFLDLCVVGEGEELDTEVLELLRPCKREGWEKAEFLRRAARIPGVYVPSLYEPAYAAERKLLDLIPLDGAPAKVTKRIVQDFEHSYFPGVSVVPGTEIVQTGWRWSCSGAASAAAALPGRPHLPADPQPQRGRRSQNRESRRCGIPAIRR